MPGPQGRRVRRAGHLEPWVGPGGRPRRRHPGLGHAGARVDGRQRASVRVGPPGVGAAGWIEAGAVALGVRRRPDPGLWRCGMTSDRSSVDPVGLVAIGALARCIGWPDLPWLGDSWRTSADEAAVMRAVCQSCPVVYACAAYADATEVTGGFWAGRPVPRRLRPTRGRRRGMTTPARHGPPHH